MRVPPTPLPQSKQQLHFNESHYRSCQAGFVDLDGHWMLGLTPAYLWCVCYIPGMGLGDEQLAKVWHSTTQAFPTAGDNISYRLVQAGVLTDCRCESESHCAWHTLVSTALLLLKYTHIHRQHSQRRLSVLQRSQCHLIVCRGVVAGQCTRSLPVFDARKSRVLDQRQPLRTTGLVLLCGNGTCFQHCQSCTEADKGEISCWMLVALCQAGRSVKGGQIEPGDLAVLVLVQCNTESEGDLCCCRSVPLGHTFTAGLATAFTTGSTC
jgi:hypothetical protein